MGSHYDLCTAVLAWWGNLREPPKGAPPLPSPSKHVKWPARHASPTALPPDQPPKDAIRRATKCTHRDKLKSIGRAHFFHVFFKMFVLFCLILAALTFAKGEAPYPLVYLWAGRSRGRALQYIRAFPQPSPP